MKEFDADPPVINMVYTKSFDEQVQEFVMKAGITTEPAVDRTV
jgi:hypothetical protein